MGPARPGGPAHAGGQPVHPREPKGEAACRPDPLLRTAIQTRIARPVRRCSRLPPRGEPALNARLGWPPTRLRPGLEYGGVAEPQGVPAGPADASEPTDRYVQGQADR